MERFKLIVSLLCLATWLPATQHCKLENLPGLAFLHCPTDTPGGSDCQGDSCDTVERGGYKAPDNRDLIIHPVVAAVLPKPAPVAADAPALVVSSSLQRALPKPSRERWQYYSVLAVPVRGPSIPS